MAKKKAHRFGEVCRLLDVQPYVLRYWETEFPALASGEENVTQRTYTDADLVVVQRIKELLYNESFTLVGAKKKLQAELDEGKLQLSGIADDVGQSDEAEAAAEADDTAADEEDEPEPVKKAKKAPVSKKTTAKTKTTKKKGKAVAQEADEDSPSVDLAELEAILGDARELLDELRG